MPGRDGFPGSVLCVWTNLLAGGVLLLAPLGVAAGGVPAGTLAGAALVLLGGYNHFRRREQGHRVAAALGGVVGVWVLAVGMETAPPALRGLTLAVGALVVIGNAICSRASR